MGKRPAAKVVAAIDNPNGGPPKSLYIEIGILWTTDKGALSGVIHSEPVAWRDPKCPRNILIQAMDRDESIVIEKDDD